MLEEFVSYKTAKLANKKGFDETSGIISEVYTEDGERYWNMAVPLVKADQKRIHAPTQGLLQKWLREKHDIEIVVSRDMEDKTLYGVRVDNYSIAKLTRYPEAEVWVVPHNHYEYFNSYEEALEKGLQEGLKLIK